MHLNTSSRVYRIEAPNWRCWHCISAREKKWVHPLRSNATSSNRFGAPQENHVLYTRHHLTARKATLVESCWWGNKVWITIRSISCPTIIPKVLSVSYRRPYLDGWFEPNDFSEKQTTIFFSTSASHRRGKKIDKAQIRKSFKNIDWCRISNSDWIRISQTELSQITNQSEIKLLKLLKDFACKLSAIWCRIAELTWIFVCFSYFVLKT